MLKTRILAWLIALFALILCFSACESTQTHTHTEVVDAAIAPTCTEVGKTEGKHCSVCNAVLVAQAEINALSHTEVVDAAVAPTCTVAGKTEGKHCSVCNTVLVAQTDINALGHTEVVDAAVAPTCTEAGKTEGKHCSVCNTVLAAQTEIKATGHNEIIDTAIAPTCTAVGKTEGRYCSECGEELVAPTEIKALGHTEVIDAAIAPTCTAVGKTEGKHCSVCNAVLVAQTTIKALGHTEVIDKAVPATESSTGLTEGKHCAVCGSVIIHQQVVDKIIPTTVDIPYGKITTSQTVIETDHLKFNIPENVYLPENLTGTVDLITSVMEKVSGMKFEGNPKYAPKLLNVQVTKPNNESELGAAYAYAGGLLISSGDLVDMFALIHESSHALQFNQSRWYYCTWAMEGISTYTTYKTQKYITANYPELVSVVNNVNQSVGNYNISNYAALYEQPIEYWMENTFTYSGNQNYSIGFRFMWYLDEVYGDYTKWIFEYEKANPYYLTNKTTDQLPVDEQIKAFKLAYGDDVFDGFYPWLKNHEELFKDDYVVDLREADNFRFYPMCAYGGIYYHLYANSGFLYKDLCIDIDAGRYYISDYKGKNTDGMVMTLDRGIAVELYDSAGRLIRSETSQGSNISLSGVSTIKLVGEGSLKRIDITGYESYSN